ncbi:hypothetical protein A2U01_0030853, partial [Trifolium medium]|nr:hypothetical protein [Trifolium medium]
GGGGTNNCTNSINRWLINSRQGIRDNILFSRTAPTAMVDASVVTSKGWLKSGKIRVGSVAIAVFNVSKAIVVVSVHLKELVLSRVY